MTNVVDFFEVSLIFVFTGFCSGPIFFLLRMFFFSFFFLFFFFLTSFACHSRRLSVSVSEKQKEKNFLFLACLCYRVMFYGGYCASLSLSLFLSLFRTLSLSLSLSLFQDNKTSHWLLYFIHAIFFNSPKQQQTRFLKNVSACQAFFKTYLRHKRDCCAVVTVLYRRTERLPVRLWLERSQMM